MTRVVDHPIRSFRGAPIQLMDGEWYAEDPHEIWSWMRREAPAYDDEAGDVWGIARLPDLALAPGELPVRASNFVSGHEAMPVRSTPIPVG